MLRKGEGSAQGVQDGTGGQKGQSSGEPRRVAAARREARGSLKRDRARPAGRPGSAGGA